MSKKRGQITLFIIIGIVLLFSTALILFIRNEVQEQEITTGKERSVQVPVESLPVADFVELCLWETGKEAINLAGSQGGYINVTKYASLNLNRQLSLSPLAYESDVLFYEPDILPYWNYVNSENRFSDIIPFLCKEGRGCGYEGPNSIEEQIAEYVKNNIDNCLNEFDDFKEVFDITKTGETVVDAIITEEDVIFELTYPIKIKSEIKTTEMDYFYQAVPVRLKGVYEFAIDIVNQEINQTFLEDIIFNIMTIYMGLDSELPPTSEFTMFSPGAKKYWIRSNVEETIRLDVLPFIRAIQVLNSYDFNPKVINVSNTNDEIKQGIYNSLIVDLNTNKSYGFGIEFGYTGAPIYLSIGDKELIGPKGTSPDDDVFSTLIGAFTEDYRFKYDMTYPVLVTITDPKAYHADPLRREDFFEFNFAVEANIVQNFARQRTTQIDKFSGVPVLNLGSYNQRINRTFNFETFDSRTKQPLDGVHVYYYCGIQTHIGTTRISNNHSVLSEKLPYCFFGGNIVLKKNGYVSISFPLNNQEGDIESMNITMPLEPTKTKKIDVQKISFEDIEDRNKNPQDLKDEEIVMLTIRKIPETRYENLIPLNGFVMIKNASVPTSSSTAPLIDLDLQKSFIEQLYDQGEIEGGDKQESLDMIDQLSQGVGNLLSSNQFSAQDHTLELAPGNYEIEATMIYTGTFTIQEKVLDNLCADEAGCSDGLKECKTHSSDIEWYETIGDCDDEEGLCCVPEMNMSTWQTGGFIGNVTIYDSDLYTDKNITFYVIDFGLPTTFDELENPADIEAVTKEYKRYLRPDFE